ncbi:MAG: hypothetical protein ACK4MQ_10145 [Hyphomonas sp.]
MMRAGPILAAIAVSSGIVLAAWGQPASCSAALDDAGRLRCDVDRAGEILDAAARLHGPQPAGASVEIVDTTSPSGAAYVYSVFEAGAQTMLEARTVPSNARNGILPACTLRTWIADDTANAISAAVTRIGNGEMPGYGPREEVTINPDGSRSVRLILDSHDIITRIETAGETRHYSRHAGSEDDVARLNSLVIGVADLSSNWSCNAR